MRLVAIVFYVLIVVRIDAVAQAEVPAGAMEAARQGLHSYLRKVPWDARGAYGFTDGDDFDRAEVGAPFPAYTIAPSNLAAQASDVSLAPLLTPTKMWYFPVLIGQESKAILVVDWMDGEWKAVSLGHAALVRELAIVRRQWPKSKGYSPVLVTAYQVRQHFFSVPEADNRNLTPVQMSDSRWVVALANSNLDRYATLQPSSNVLSKLRLDFEAVSQQVPKGSGK